jgi:hypothetical protein
MISFSNNQIFEGKEKFFNEKTKCIDVLFLSNEKRLIDSLEYTYIFIIYSFFQCERSFLIDI